MAAIDDWMQGDGTDALDGGDDAAKIDDNVTAYLQDPLGILLANYRRGVQVTYSSTSAVTVGIGEVVCANSGATVLRMRKMVATQSCNTLDTGSLGNSATYYVYATADTSDGVFSAIISINASFPSTGVTYAKKLAQFKTNGSAEIVEDSIYQSDLTVARAFGSWQTKANATVYLAATDGFVTANQGVSGNQTVIQILSDGSNPPTTVRIDCYRDSPTGSHNHYSGTCPVKKGDYWTTTGAVNVFWTPLI